MAWGRIVQCDIGTTGSGLRVSGLDIDFSVDRSRLFSDNKAQLTVYNASDDTVKKILAEGNNIVLKAGYEDQSVGAIFIGNITHVDDGFEGSTRKTSIEAHAIRSEKAPLARTIVSLSYSAGSKYSDIVQAIAGLMGLNIEGLDIVAELTIPGAICWSCRWRRAFSNMCKLLASNGIGCYLDNSDIILFSFSGQGTYEANYLTYDNGLVSVSDITKSSLDEDGRDDNGFPLDDPKKRIKAESLLNWRIRPDGLVKIETATVNGVFIVDKVHFEGNNYGGDFKIEFEATE